MKELYIRNKIVVDCSMFI